MVAKKERWLVLAIAAVMFLAIQTSKGDALAAYPERPVNLLVGFTPGGPVDLSARALANAVKRILGVPVVIDNKPGGTGTVALAAMLAQNPDGYTLSATPSSVLIRVPQTQQVPFKPLRSFLPIVGYAAPQLGIVVKKDAPWKTLSELVNDAGKHPGKLKYATTGVGSTTHAAVEEIAGRDKLQMIHIPYKGDSEALTALLGGHVDFASLTSGFIPSLKAGQTRLLATMNEKRSPDFPNIPTLKEEGYDFVNDAVFSIVGPANLPPEVATKLGKAFGQALGDKAYREVLEKIDMVPVSYDGKQFAEFLKTNWAKINKHLIATGLIKQAATMPQ